jgi:hypothetical protein
MKQLKSIVDQNGNIVEPGGLMRSAYVNAIVLAASVANTDTPPAGSAYVLISPSVSPTYVNIGAAATIPGASIQTGLSSTLLNAGFPRLFSIEGATTIGLICGSNSVVTLEYFGPLD